MGSSSLSKKLVYDEVRKLWVKASPEEIVRQQWLKAMINSLGYPRELLVVEKELKELPHLLGAAVPDRRVDILCYGKGIQPLLLIECKAGALTDEALDQVVGYNHYVKADFAAIVNGREARITNRTTFPSYMELMQWVKR
jgi:hypothetical protein